MRFTLTDPMFIGARLMPAARVGASTIHVFPHARDDENRVVWRYIIEDSDGYVLDDATALSSGTGDDIDPRQALATLAEFLTAAAEAYRHTLNGQPSDNSDLFPPDVSEWAYEHDDELAALALELTPNDPDTPVTSGQGDQR